MATLYEIDAAIMECVDAETGEIIDCERLNALVMEKNAKLEGVALYIKNLESDAAAFKAEKEAFAAREATATNKAKRLKEWLTEALGGQKFSTAKCAVTFRKSERVEVDENCVPKKYQTKTVTFKPDKKAIKALLKAGKRIKGCCIVENQNIQIK